MIALAITSILLNVHSRLSRGWRGAAPPAPIIPVPACGEGVQGKRSSNPAHKQRNLFSQSNPGFFQDRLQNRS